MNHQLKLIKVIKPGVLIRTETGIILDARSTVTLIQSNANNILVDTSLKEDRELILQGLSELGLTPFDITIVINTHTHRDHVGNNNIFPSARIYTHAQGKQLPNSVKIKSFPFHFPQEENLELIETPGHSWDSISVIAKMEVIYVITGDAIPLKNNYLEWIPPAVHVDVNQALDSMKKIVQIADIIIPGHDSPFKVMKPKKGTD